MAGIFKGLRDLPTDGSGRMGADNPDFSLNPEAPSEKKMNNVKAIPGGENLKKVLSAVGAIDPDQANVNKATGSGSFGPEGELVEEDNLSMEDPDSFLNKTGDFFSGLGDNFKGNMQSPEFMQGLLAHLDAQGRASRAGHLEAADAAFAPFSGVKVGKKGSKMPSFSQLIKGLRLSNKKQQEIERQRGVNKTKQELELKALQDKARNPEL